MTLTTFAPTSAAAHSPLRALIAGARKVGGVYDLQYRQALVLTNDYWVREVGGLPEHSFLVATVLPADGRPAPADDEEVVLLRVEGTARLPRQADLVDTRESAVRNALTTDDPAGGTAAGMTGAAPLDPLTLEEIQYAGLQCRVLGTFYDDETSNGRRYLAFGSDLDTIYAASRYNVYKPSAEALSVIASYPARTEEDAAAGVEPKLLELGAIRYSSTRRRANLHKERDLPVRVRVEDFVSMKTAVFGMTRMGKSNTVKVLSAAIFEWSMDHDTPVGQLLLDPQGEYANATEQDEGTALADLGDEFVAVYRYNPRAGERGRPLRLNFYDESQLAAVQEIVGTVLADAGASAVYINRFIGAELGEPAESDFATPAEYQSARHRTQRARFLLHALLAKAEFPVPGGRRFVASMSRDLANEILADHPEVLQIVPRAVAVEGPQDLVRVADWLVEHRKADHAAATDWLDGEATQAVLAVYDGGTTRAGIGRIRGLRDFHDATARTDYAEQIQQELERGRLVIVDLSRGSDRVLQTLSERLIRHIVARASERFTAGEEPIRMQVVLEEAHRLFDRKSFDKNERDPYVVLAKEAAKYRIGLTYSTQEVSGVAPQVLSNTSNWVVAHLNSSREVDELSRYYDFGTFKQAILTSEDRGFVRLKTRSGKFIVPTHVAKFGVDTIARSRQRGLERLERKRAAEAAKAGDSAGPGRGE